MVAALKSSFQQRNDVTPGEQASPSETQARERAEALGREMFELTAHISAAEARFFELLPSSIGTSCGAARDVTAPRIG